MLSVISWNVNSFKVRWPQVLNLIDHYRPDMLALQETKLIDEAFPDSAVREAGYHPIYSGQKMYNGVAFLSRFPIEKEKIPIFFEDQKRLIVAFMNDILFINVYVPNGESPDSVKYEYKLVWLEALKNYVQQQLKKFSKILILGDFNIAPQLEDVYDPIAWRGRILFTEPERQAFQALLDLGFTDTFRLFPQAASLFSWWDYRMGAFRRNQGLRIDHILASQALVKDCKQAFIDKSVRALERPSDHAPVILYL